VRNEHLVTVSLVLCVSCGGSDPPPVAEPLGSSKAAAAAGAADGPPVAEVRPVTTTHHGVAVADPYQWLEGDTAEVKAWSDGQNRHARRILDQLPELDALRGELRAILTAPIVFYGRPVQSGGKWFVLRKLPDKEQAQLVVMDDPEQAGDARLVLDPTAAGDIHRTIDWFVASPDGSKVAVSLSVGGSEDGTVHIVDLEGREVDAAIPDVQRGTGGGDVAWTPDGKGLWYTRYPGADAKPEDRNHLMQVWFHELGKPAKSDRYELGEGLPRIAEIRLESDRRGRVLASVQNGDSGVFRHYLRDAKKGTWRQLDDWGDAVVFAGFGPTEDLWLISRAGAPKGKVLRLPASARGPGDAKVVVPEGEHSIVTDYYEEQGVEVGRDRFYAVYQLGGPAELRAFGLDGKKADRQPALPPISSVGRPSLWKGGVLVKASSYTTPPATYRFTSRTGKMDEVKAMSPRPPVDLAGWEVHREMATSKDGTKVPMNVVWRRGAPRDGSSPCVVTGYGGYAVSEEPFFLAIFEPLMRRGLCVASANLRGGGEFGEEWHRAGMLERKQNVFDDFAAVLDEMVARRYTRSDRMAIFGGSNGGLLMGAMITQHPDKVRAVVSAVGIYDMLRVELSPNGSYNIPEYGTVKERSQFQAMYAYSPYHRVRPGTVFPAILMTSGANDPRVSPWQSRKMTAALQAARKGDAPILLRTSDTAGHGSSTGMSEKIEEFAHIQAFLLWQVGGGAAR
jgi:prolyl oligopeptidase